MRGEGKKGKQGENRRREKAISNRKNKRLEAVMERKEQLKKVGRKSFEDPWEKALKVLQEAVIKKHEEFHHEK